MLLTVWLASALWSPVAGQGYHPAAKDEHKRESMRGPSGERRVPCDAVIAAISREVRVQKGRSADMSLVAKRLGTDISWVEHCMLIYGRRPKRPGLESAETREARMEHWEEDEPEESATEDVQEPGAQERETRKPKPRVGHIRPTPSPVAPRD